MKKYKVKIRQCRPTEVWADNEDEAFNLAMEASEWDDDYEVIDEADEEDQDGWNKIISD
ncbi:hypothetical protein [Anaerovorax sp. IOR16]|uniref:hypothetical protein n=1 Tax=Anaerovorax sp. IOR16 TaxID=2773458 RepID=UPI0019D29DEB|nr:hypothetical protein [Anaerovorax sp. IOR16]